MKKVYRLMKDPRPVIVSDHVPDGNVEDKYSFIVEDLKKRFSIFVDPLLSI